MSLELEILDQLQGGDLQLKLIANSLLLRKALNGLSWACYQAVMLR